MLMLHRLAIDGWLSQPRCVRTRHLRQRPLTRILWIGVHETTDNVRQVARLTTC